MFKKIKNKLLQIWQFIINSVKIFYTRICVKKFKNKHQGQRCFIVGNGPSLLPKDLDNLKNDICFGTHRIYNIFSETEWRPDYYCVQDSNLIYQSLKDIKNLDIKHKFLLINKSWKYPYFPDTLYLNLFSKDFYPEPPEFSADIAKGLYGGYTVSYMCLQMAVYMGFKEIYLIGVDHSYSVTLQPDGSLSVNNEIKNHFSEKDNLANVPQLFKSTLAYESAKKYATEHGIKIYNATRGGKLEVFERINFDELFSQGDSK